MKPTPGITPPATFVVTVDIERYRRHPKCDSLWCVAYDPGHLITDAEV